MVVEVEMGMMEAKIKKHLILAPVINNYSHAIVKKKKK